MTESRRCRSCYSRCPPPTFRVRSTVESFGGVFRFSLFFIVVWGCGCGGDETADSTVSSSRGVADRVGKVPPEAAIDQVAMEDRRPPDRVLPKFDMVGLESGFDFERFDDIQGQRRIIETNGGGVGLLDFDNDGWIDIFMTNGCRLPVSLDDHSTPSALFRNLSDMQFERVSQNASLQQFGYSYGCAVADFDADGFDDLYVTAFGSNTFWRNNGDGTFSDVTGETKTGSPTWSSSAAFADINLDGHLDLYVVNYLEESDTEPHLCRNPASPTGFTGCSPAIMEGVDDVLFLSDGAGGFVDATESSGLKGMKGKGLGVVIVDLDGQLGPEIYVANDGQANFMLKREGKAPHEASGESSVRPVPVASDDLVFVDHGFASATALNESGFAQASMGIAVGDYDGNGTCDLFLTHFFGDTNTLYSNQGGLTFTDESRSSRLGFPSRETLGFGTVFFDADQDGWQDLFIANGHVDDRTWMPHPQPYKMPQQLMLNSRDGTFLDASAWCGEYFQRSWIGRGVAAGDLDRDGRADLVVSHQLAPSVILRNRTPIKAASHSLRLVGTQSGRSAVGAVVSCSGGVGPSRSVLPGGGSFQSASSMEFIVYGDAVDVEWPLGLKQSIHLSSPSDVTVIESGVLID